MQIRKLIISSLIMAIRYDSCADLGMFVNGGDPGPSGIKSSDNMFFCCCFFSPQLI